MKLKTAFFLVSLSICYLLPLCAPGFEAATPADEPSALSTDAAQAESDISSESSAPSRPSASAEPSAGATLSPFTWDGGPLRILNETTGKVDRVALYDYVRGAIAAEMPPDFHLEALKAQGTASLTFALRQRSDSIASGAEYDLSCDPANRLGYVTEDEAREMYGDSFAIHWSKMTSAADEAVKHIMVYENGPILAAYHAISGGVTESAENIWGGAVPYLTPVESAGDLLAPEYLSTASFADAEVSAALLSVAPEAVLSGEPSLWFSEPSVTSSGYVTEIKAGGVFFTGAQIRDMLDLRSGAFTVEHGAGGFVFTVRGYGHGVGLSQRGADYMARQGADFREILEHYYAGAQLRELSAAP